MSPDDESVSMPSPPFRTLEWTPLKPMTMPLAVVLARELRPVLSLIRVRPDGKMGEAVKLRHSRGCISPRLHVCQTPLTNITMPDMYMRTAVRLRAPVGLSLTHAQWLPISQSRFHALSSLATSFVLRQPRTPCSFVFSLYENHGQPRAHHNLQPTRVLPRQHLHVLWREHLRERRLDPVLRMLPLELPLHLLARDPILAGRLSLGL